MNDIITTYIEKFKQSKHSYLQHLRETNQYTEEIEQKIMDLLESVDTFVEKMDDKEKYALLIAIEHLEDSFDIEKCIMFKKFK